jgi:hypothetical protein
MLRSNAFARVVAGAVQAPSTHSVSHLTRTFQRLSLAPRLNSRGAITHSLSRAFATKIVKRKLTKKKTAAASKSRPTAKKPAPKKKKTPARPKRKAVKKKVVVKPKRKVPTEKQKVTAAKKKERDELKKLKETALLTTAPKQKAASAWNVYVSEALGGSTGRVTGAIKETSTKFKTLSASELEVRFFSPSYIRRPQD